MTRKILVEDDASQYASINQRLRRLEQGVPEDPHYIGNSGEPAFQNSWTHYSISVWGKGGFYRDRGRVYLMGLVMSGGSGTVIFTLPGGYRPPVGFICPVSASGGAAELRVLADGSVAAYNLTGTTITTWLSLGGASFRHA